MNERGFYTAPIRDNLHWVTDGSYQSLFLTTDVGVVVIDAPPTIGHNLLRAIKQTTTEHGLPSNVTHVVYSHFHADHIGAAALLGDGVEIVAHQETLKQLRRVGNAERPLPTTTFTDNYVLEVGGEEVVLEYHGPNHSVDNIFIHLPRHETLCVVDVFTPGWVPFRNFMVAQDIPAWISVNQRILDAPWTTFVGGHAGRLGTRADAQLQADYVNDLVDSVRETNRTFDPLKYFVKYGPAGNGYAAMLQYLQDISKNAAAPVIEKYIDTLAGADVMTAENAFSLVEVLRNDHGELPGIFGIAP